MGMECFEQDMSFKEINKQLKISIKKIGKDDMYLLLQLARGMELK